MLALVRPVLSCPVPGRVSKMLAAHGRLAWPTAFPTDSIVLARTAPVVELGPLGVRIVDEVDTGVTFVDGLGVGDVQDVALRDRRHLSEDGVLIIVATVGGSNGVPTGGRS